MKKTAIISEDEVYRYLLTRTWDENKPKVLFIMLNPSTADHKFNDPTITRCLSFADSWNFGALHVVNLFAYRTSDVKELYKAKQPMGPENDRHILQQAELADKIVAAWSNDGAYMKRSTEVKDLLRSHGFKLHYIKLNKTGEPTHPLYLDSKLGTTKWNY